MENAMNWLGVGLVWLIMGVVTIYISFCCLGSDLKSRLYPDGNNQPLITTCQVDKKIKNSVKEEVKKPDGYFYDGKDKKDCWIVETSQTEYKVKYRTLIVENDNIIFSTSKWIPRKDFHKYYTTEELSEIINKKK